MSSRGRCICLVVTKRTAESFILNRENKSQLTSLRFFPLNSFILFVFQHVYNFSGIIVTECFCDDWLTQYLQSLNCGKHVYKEKDGTHKKIYQASFVPRKHRSGTGYGSYPSSYEQMARSGHHWSVGWEGSSSVLTSLRMVPQWSPVLVAIPRAVSALAFCDSMIQTQVCEKQELSSSVSSGAALLAFLGHFWLFWGYINGFCAVLEPCGSMWF